MLSGVILAGGRSQRMGSDKAFLEYDGVPFIRMITDELLKLTNDVVVTVGEKEKRNFERLLNDSRVRIVNDVDFSGNPLGGMFTGFECVKGDYSAVVACDSPLIHADLIDFLYSISVGFSASVPIWDKEDKMTCEPLIGIYNVRQTRSAIIQSMSSGVTGCKRMLAKMDNVNFVPADDLRCFDPFLASLLNINSPRDYEEMVSRHHPASLKIID